jgi:hypothetical protein
MVERGAAIQLSEEEISSWNGAYHYLPMVLVKGKRYRICFDAARSQCGAPAFNKHLYKGPDRFVNNIAAVILGFRNGRYAAVADLSKFHNQIFLVEEDIHMQRFLWRGMNTDIPPQTYAVCVNNFGVTSANCVATCALHKSADSFSDIYPKESAEIKTQTYIDDELVASPTMGELLVKTKTFDKICDHAGMTNKGWTYSGDHSDTSFAIGKEEGVACDKVLGMMYSSKCDVFTFKAALRFKIDGKEVEITCLKDFLEILFDLILTRRIVLSNVARIFDPIGFLCPILLQSKILMREMWTDKNIGWDDPISAEMSEKWIDFLSSLLNLVDIAFQRSLWPDAEVEGLPILIIFSDGSILAFGAVAYIRWKLKNGGYWARLIMAKCKIAPKNMLSIPRMELNGAVLGNRVKNFILKDTNMKFSKVYQLVDSSTVLGYAQKEYGAFKPYEGIRVAEIQSTNEFEGKRLKGFAWVAGPNNPADWCTKPRRVENLLLPFWPSGPPFIYENECDWPIKFTYKKDDFEGMQRVHTHVYYAFAQIASNDFITRLVIRCSSWKKIYRTFGWMLRVAFPVTSNVLLPSELSRAKAILLKYAQKDSVKDLLEAEKEGKGCFRKLAPLQDDVGLYRVGSRMKHHVPFTHDKKLPVILPNEHRITLLIMRESHQFSHSGQDGTLSRFRSQGYWTTRGGQLAKTVKNDCIPCRKYNHETMRQPMGEFPEDRLQQLLVWGICQLDLFGPFLCRGDVNPRTTKKIWGLLIEDVNSGAVHIDVVTDYSTEAVIMALVRFGESRGYPKEISSDPGSQLESASGILEKWWKSMAHSLREFSSSNSFEWKVSPPDSPWRQGKAERRIGIVKKLIHHSIGDSRLTPLELQTAFIKIANICNERPLGLSKPREDGSYELITPNQLLMGNNSNVWPDDTNLADTLGVKARYQLVKHVTDVFWHKWSTNVSPSLVLRQKWHVKTRNLCVGDLVMICEDSKIKSKYKMGVVEVVKQSNDGVVRSATVRYVNITHNPRGEDDVSTVHVRRSIQRLVLIMPVEEMTTSVVVKDFQHCVKCVVQL